MLLIAAAFAAGAFLIFGTDDSADHAETDPALAIGAPPAPVPTFGVGATQLTDGLAVTLEQVEDPWVSEFEAEQAAAGRRLVAVEISVVNTTAEPVTLLSQTMIKLVDGAGNQAPYAFAGLDLTHIDGEAAPGLERSGWVVFDVPADATDLTLEVRGAVLAPPVAFEL